MAIAQTYGVSAVGHVDSVVRIDPVSYACASAEYDFVVGVRKLRITDTEAHILQELISSSMPQSRAITIKDMAVGLNLDLDEMSRVFDDFLRKLDNFTIANNGGTGSVFYEDSVHASDLIISNGDSHSFNLPLAELIGPEPTLTEEQLYSINFQPRWYQQKFVL